MKYQIYKKIVNFVKNNFLYVKKITRRSDLHLLSIYERPFWSDKCKILQIFVNLNTNKRIDTTGGTRINQCM